jgi:uncharacterized protein involved in outer membrane biogenesis
MSGTLHIFRRSVVNGEPHYQVNYTTTGSSYARVFETDAGLTDFLIESGALEEGDMNAFWDALAANGSATVSDVDIPERETPMMGLKQTPSEF